MNGVNGRDENGHDETDWHEDWGGWSGRDENDYDEWGCGLNDGDERDCGDWRAVGGAYQPKVPR